MVIRNSDDESSLTMMMTMTMMTTVTTVTTVARTGKLHLVVDDTEAEHVRVHSELSHFVQEIEHASPRTTLLTCTHHRAKVHRVLLQVALPHLLKQSKCTSPYTFFLAGRIRNGAPLQGRRQLSLTSGPRGALAGVPSRERPGGSVEHTLMLKCPCWTDFSEQNARMHDAIMRLIFISSLVYCKSSQKHHRCFAGRV